MSLCLFRILMLENKMSTSKKVTDEILQIFNSNSTVLFKQKLCSILLKTLQTIRSLLFVFHKGRFHGRSPLSRRPVWFHQIIHFSSHHFIKLTITIFFKKGCANSNRFLRWLFLSNCVFLVLYIYWEYVNWYPTSAYCMTYLLLCLTKNK